MPSFIRRIPREPYPRTVAECIDPNKRYRPGVLASVRTFARSRPWRGTIDERREKFRTLHEALCRVYGLETVLEFRCLADVSSGSSHYIPSVDRIVLSGHLSVVTYLHEFAHALGRGERGACRWSINLFRRCFPRSFARCRHQGHMLLRPA